MFEGQPRGLWTLAFANTGERFGYYTMLAVFSLFLGEAFGLSADDSAEIYSGFLMLVYFLPLFGGMAADRWGYARMVVVGIAVMFLGYALLSLPLGGGQVGLWAMLGALLLVSLGTGLFKGNLQVMVGDLYAAPRFSARRAAGFSLFYMLINVGALFAPTAAVASMRWGQEAFGFSHADSYHFAFGVACLSVVASIAIFYLGRSTFAVAKQATQQGADETAQEMSPRETKQRIVCLALVFAVVIFFWMAFSQNGLTLTWFADEYTARTASGLTAQLFSVWNLMALCLIVYAAFSLPSAGRKGRTASWLIIAAAAAYIAYGITSGGDVAVEAPIFQQFNPMFVVALTPVSLWLFGSLARKGKEPSAPTKIALGMLLAAVAYGALAGCSIGLPQSQHPEHVSDQSPNILIGTYLVLTFAELLLSPIGISFVSKVAPPKYRGMMMGGWFVSTAIGNKLVALPARLWETSPLWQVWAVLAAVCLVACLAMACMVKKIKSIGD